LKVEREGRSSKGPLQAENVPGFDRETVCGDRSLTPDRNAVDRQSIKRAEDERVCEIEKSCPDRLVCRFSPSRRRRKTHPGIPSSLPQKRKVRSSSTAWLWAHPTSGRSETFEEKYGIKMESLDLRASELAERVRTEQAAGGFLGDVEIITTTMIEEQRKNGDYIQNMAPFPTPQICGRHSRPRFQRSRLRAAMGILVNTRLVQAGR